MDTFTWGNTRVVMGEKGGKQIVAVSDEPFDPRSIPLQFWDDYAAANGLPYSNNNNNTDVFYDAPYDDDGYEMDELRSVYSSGGGRPVSAMAMLKGSRLYLPPGTPSRSQTPAPSYNQHQLRPSMQQRQSTYSHFSRYTDLPPSPDQHTHHPTTSRTNLLSPSHSRQHSASLLDPHHYQRSTSSSTDNLLQAARNEDILPPSDEEIGRVIRECLAQVDLEKVTKRELKGLVVRRLGLTVEGQGRAWVEGRVDGGIDVELGRM